MRVRANPHPTPQPAARRVRANPNPDPNPNPNQVILSGPLALPVQFVERLANAAGTHMEEAWRRRMLDHLLDVTVTWVRSP